MIFTDFLNVFSCLYKGEQYKVSLTRKNFDGLICVANCEFHEEHDNFCPTRRETSHHYVVEIVKTIPESGKTYDCSLNFTTRKQAFDLYRTMKQGISN
jgi:hypothetical protein